MDADKVKSLVADAKYLYDHGAFSPLAQTEFFTALGAELADYVPPAPSPSPPPEEPV
jgi:hypothetical protein